MMRRALAVVLLATAVLPVPVQAQLAVRGARVHTVSGASIDDGVVLIEKGKIRAVGRASELPIPEGWRVLRAAVVTPGLVDAHSVVGLAGVYNRNQDQDQLDRSEAIQPALRAIDAFNFREPLVGWLREHGVTTVHTGHAPGALVPGRSMVVKTREAAPEDTALVPDAMVLAVLGEAARRSGGKAPGNRAKMAAMLRQELLAAREYARKRAVEDAAKRPERDLGLEALAEVVEGKRRLLVTAHRDRDILTALRIAEEFGIDLVLDGAAEAHLLIDRIREAGVPVILHAPMLRHTGDAENASFETGARLREAGILFAFQSGYESYVPKTRVLLFEAAVAAANGLGPEATLRAITLDAARILGVEKRVGSLEAGKDADLVLFDGDPFEYTSHVVAVVIDGEVVSETRR